MNNNCFGCKHFAGYKKDFREIEQARCLLAEKLFGGERWVNILDQTTCGGYEASTDKKESPSDNSMKDVWCPHCSTTGYVFTDGLLVESEEIIEDESFDNLIECPLCSGEGVLE